MFSIYNIYVVLVTGIYNWHTYAIIYIKVLVLRVIKKLVKHL